MHNCCMICAVLYIIFMGNRELVSSAEMYLFYGHLGRYCGAAVRQEGMRYTPKYWCTRPPTLTRDTAVHWHGTRLPRYLVVCLFL